MTERGYTYDTGALLAAEARRVDVWALHKRCLVRRVTPTVPAAVLAQAWRGGPQPLLSKLLGGCAVEPMTEEEARAAGRLCGLAGSADVVDAAVVVGAAERKDLVVTSDPRDLVRLAEALGHKLDVHVI